MAVLNKNRRNTKKVKPMGQGAFSLTVHRVLQNRGAVVGLIVFCILVLIAVLGEWIMPYDYAAMNLANTFAPPSAEHLLGTDDMGRDILSRLIYGARYSLSLGFLSCAVSTTIGLVLGAIAGFFGGKVDLIIMRILDVISAIPNILLAICISATLGNGFLNTILALGMSGIPSVARVMRASMLNVRELEYVEAAKSINCKYSRIIAVHVVPNAIAPVIVQVSLSIASSLISAASLSYIGLGIQPPTPEWGAMLSAGRAYIREYPNLTFIPGVAVLITVLCMNLIGDALRDALDPKLKK